MAHATGSGPRTDNGRRPRPWTPHLSGVAALLLDEEGRVTQWGGAAARLFGRPAERAVGRHLVDLLPGARAETVLRAVTDAASGVPRSDLLFVESGDGLRRELAFTWEPLTRPGPWGAVLVTAADAALARGVTDPTGGERLALLHELSSRVSSTLDPLRVAEDAVDVAVPRFADSAGLYIAEGLLRDEAYPDHDADGSLALRRLALRLTRRRTDDHDWSGAFPAGEIVRYYARHPAHRCMATGRPVIYTVAELEPIEIDKIASVLGGTGPAPLDEITFLAVPLTARGMVLGFISFIRGPGRPRYTGDDVKLAEDLAARAAICIDNARLYSRERRTAQSLQQNLAPSNLTVPPGLEVAHRYLPVSAMTVGGDWYDVIPLSETRMALVMGDAMGHGAAAAGAMSQLRASVRTLAGFDLPPDEVLRRLDLMAGDMDAIQCATCLYATIDLSTRICALSRAGHPPPILVYPDGTASVLDLPTGLALGVGDPDHSQTYATTEVTIPAGATLALYTDGLVESREQDIDTGIAALVDHLRSPGPTLDATCATIIDALPTQYDDVALLLARITTDLQKR
ncbi:SpoIIE family protein phosphatase [Sphaerisporangium aureirubrum]|uniref:SpoIIE family protein phosphatase n=1 Tax=Sphaerisporangium aureirubrum TaxID=1544736 RepID=A0ABW1NL60_9ACTN